MKFLTFLIRFSVTLLVVAIAIFAGWRLWIHYMESPWTRDARVRVNVVTIAPDVAGAIVDLRVKDNQKVSKGDILFIVDQARYRLALQETAALVKTRTVEAEQRKRELERREKLADSSAISREMLETAENVVITSQALLDQAIAAHENAKLNMERTEVRSPVNGFVTNLQLEVGDYATVGKPMLAMVNSDSYYVAGYFEETKVHRIREGDPVIIRLMGFSEPLTGKVESIAPAIADRENVVNTDLVANVNPTFSWVRLAQRIPVRIAIEKIPDDVRLSAGMTATVKVEEKK
ncbi:MAG: efflux RND transporter periplasmic adaptor subunit [Puniceicoccales bacterium]|jgi:RND family efflux transporter MFP subunit|nr:efflux RND transporter periplasmic adaptor subunit [Puniceicoccales bacterium]